MNKHKGPFVCGVTYLQHSPWSAPVTDMDSLFQEKVDSINMYVHACAQTLHRHIPVHAHSSETNCKDLCSSIQQFAVRDDGMLGREKIPHTVSERLSLSSLTSSFILLFVNED